MRLISKIYIEETQVGHDITSKRCLRVVDCCNKEAQDQEVLVVTNPIEECHSD